ncbi:MAG: hypothetical protein J2P53_14245 [Bradyrhizobiaceae bacterium]|nr:hypothetical protein [Bradyrhizobiaceae bacterium]
MTAQPVETSQKASRRFFALGFSSRSFSIILALVADGILILLLFRRHWIAPTTDIEPFWVEQFVAFAIYSALQLWTLAYQTGRGDELAATVDKVFAASPAIVTALIQMYWMGHDASASLTWRQHVVSALWSLFAIADFFATDVTNQRLRLRQLNLATGN